MKFYVTTAIAYVNDKPGLHHAYEFTGEIQYAVAN